MRRSKTLDKLRNGKVALGGNISLGASLITAGFAGKVGMDFTWIDMEHRWFTWTDAAMMAYGCREGDVDPMIRVNGTDAPDFHRAFEVGASGVMLPHCRTRQAAEHVVDCSKYPPLGRRSKEDVGIDGSFSFDPTGTYIEDFNRESFIAVQIEDIEGVENAEEIIAVKGVEAIFVGPGDLTQALGKPGDKTNPEYIAAEKKVAAACEKYGKAWGLPLPATEDAMKAYIDKGARFLVPFGDFPAILKTWPAEMEMVRNVLAKEGLD